MTTIEIFQTDLKRNKRLIKKIYNLLDKYSYIHFLYEPKLIIRTTDKHIQFLITEYLKKRNLKYRTYKYPFGKGYGESPKSVVYKYLSEFQMIMHFNSRMAIKRNKNQDLRIFERETHTMFNSFGYEWEDEVMIYTWLARGRTATIKKYGSHSLASLMLCTLIIFIFKLNIIFIKLLK